MSRILVIAYSFTGTSKRVAELLVGINQWTLGEIRDVRPRKGAGGNLRCLLDSLFRRHPEIHYSGPDPSGFDAVVLVSPIWAYRLAGPMRSFVAAHRSSLGDVAVVSVMGESGAPNAVAEVSGLLGRPTLMDAAFKTSEVEDGSCAVRLQGFAKAVEEAEGASQTARPFVWSARTA